MNENIKTFMEAVSADKELEKELLTAFEGVTEPKERTAVVIDFAKAKGFELAEEDLILDGQKIDLDELDTVAGGGGCGCFVGGGGYGYDDETGKRYDCECFAHGQGDIDSNGYHNKDSNLSNCFCAIVGGGSDGYKV